MSKTSKQQAIVKLLEKNRAWAENITANHPGFFDELSQQQNPDYLWIGCSDSRVPATQLVGCMPGEVFVHRNIANSVIAGDLNCMSVLEYAVGVLKVKHVIVCGHYGCGGVMAAMSGQSHGSIDAWLANIKTVYHKYRDTIDAIANQDEQVSRLCELNVIEQVANVSRTPVVQKTWLNGGELSIHGLIYNLKDGALTDLDTSIHGQEQVPQSFQMRA